MILQATSEAGLTLSGAPSLFTFATGFVVATIASLLLTPLVRDAARASGWVDPSDGERKLHITSVPRIGGVAIVLATLLAIGTLHFDSGVSSIDPSWNFLIIAVGAVCIHLLGILDDLRAMRARYKLFWQVAISIGVVWAGLRVDVISVPGFHDVTLPPAIGAIVTVTWLVGVTNAFNLIDGVDGLASGAALVALMTMSAVGLVNHQWAAAWLTLTLAGAVIGFLVFNFHPASIFLGDSGSLFLGFVLAGLGVITAQKSSTAVAVAVPVLVLGLPMLDTGLAIVRRYLRGQSVFTADRGHIHHRLLGQGMSPRRVTLTLYGVCGALGLAGFILLTRPELNVIVLILLGLGGGVFVHSLRIHEFEELAGSVVRTASQRLHIERSVRIRECAARIEESRDLDTIFGILAQTCPTTGFVRTEVSLRRSFLDHAATMAVSDGRGVEEAGIWACGDADLPDAAWQMRFPIITARGARIGTIACWMMPSPREHAVSHLRTLSTYLAVALADKLVSLWHSSVHSLNPAPAEARPSRRSGRHATIVP